VNHQLVQMTLYSLFPRLLLYSQWFWTRAIFPWSLLRSHLSNRLLRIFV
jgi:hypothetical protein